jgi:hypothetical protein
MQAQLHPCTQSEFKDLRVVRRLKAISLQSDPRAGPLKPDSRRQKVKGLAAEGGFVPQSYIDSVQLTDSTIVPNAKKGYKGKSFIQFSFSSCFQRSTRILAWVHSCTVRLERGTAVKGR